MDTKKFSFNLPKIFSIYIALIPIIQYYRSPLSSLNLATFMAVLFCVIFLLKRIVVLDARLFPAILYVIYMSIHFFVIGGETSAYLRMMLLVISIVILGHQYFDFKYALRVIELILTISTVLMVFQFVGYYFLNSPISGTIPFLLTSEGSGYAVASSRPSGIYLEPAQYSQTAIMYLSFKLFSKECLSSKDLKCVLLVIAGIVLSGSGQGYVLLGCLLCAYFIYSLLAKNITADTALKIILIVVVTVVGAIILWKYSPYVQYVVSRFVGEDGSLGGSAYGGRSYTNKLFYLLNPNEQMYGIGIGYSDSFAKGYYVNSLYFYLIENGYSSLVILSIIILYIFFKGNLSVKIYSIALVALFVFSGVGRPMMLCYFMLFMLFYGNNVLIQDQSCYDMQGMEKYTYD